MLFSIVVPIYNVEKYIRECLDNLVGQSFGDFELILVDDGSTDSSGQICDEYASKDPRILVIHKANEGLLMARRTGIKECHGDYILHCDSDDYLATETLSLLKNAIAEHHPDMVMFGYNVVDDNRNVLEEHHTVFRNGEFFDKKDKERILNELASTTWLNNMVTKATKREHVDVDADYSEYRNIKMGEDLFQVIPLIESCSTFFYVAQPFYFYRYNPKGISKNVDRSYLDNHMEVSERLYALLKKEKVSDKTFLNFYNRYVKDIYKYLLRFAKANVRKEEFTEICCSVEDNRIFNDAKAKAGDWSAVNKLLGILIRSSNYRVIKFLSNTVISRRL